MNQIIIMILLMLILNLLYFKIKKEYFKNYSYIPNFLIYQHEDKLYKLKNKNKDLDDFYSHIEDESKDNMSHLEQINLKKIIKKDDIINIQKECNKEGSYKNFKYLNCKNQCNFIKVSDKHQCIKDCSYLNNFNSNNCFIKLHNKHYTIN